MIPTRTTLAQQLTPEVLERAIKAWKSVCTPADPFAKMRDVLLDALLPSGAAPAPRCPNGHPLQKVTRPSGSMLNDDQFDAVKAGDWFCETCQPNGRSATAACYFWNHELAGASPAEEERPRCIACESDEPATFEVEDGPGPFCGMCWEAIESAFGFKADVKRVAAAQAAPALTRSMEQLKEAIYETLVCPVERHGRCWITSTR